MEVIKGIFICEMNFDRSPAAAHIANVQASQRGLPIRFSSAGLRQSRYVFMSEYMVEALTRSDYPEPISHTPRQADSTLLADKKLIFCFQQYQIDFINRILGKTEDSRIYTLAGYTGETEDILNPQAYIKNTFLSAAVMLMPGSLQADLSQKLGYVHTQNSPGLVRVHDNVVRRIEQYIPRMLDRIAAEMDTLATHSH